jgi:uncharacterized DUF497 family protein
MQFTWDQKKATSNRRKHEITFEEATNVFSDPHASIFDDPGHSVLEHREIVVGMSQNRLLLVSFTERQGIIRIISARRATARERKHHEEKKT